MASGDPVFIKQIAKASTGVPPYFNYTTTVDFVITGWTCEQYHVNFGTWVDLTSGIYGFLPDTGGGGTGSLPNDRKLLESGDSLTAVSNNNNRFGITISGFEI